MLQGLVPTGRSSSFNEASTGDMPSLFALFGVAGLFLGPCQRAFIFDITNRQPQQFHGGCIVGEMAPVLVTLRNW